MDHICPAVVSQRNLTLGWNQNFVASGKVLPRQTRELSVGDADQSAVESPNSGRPQANILDRTACITGLWKVSRSHNPVQDDGNSTQDVLQSLLGGEGDRNSTGTESWQDGGGVKTEAVQATIFRTR